MLAKSNNSLKARTFLPAIASMVVFAVVYFTASSALPDIVKGVTTAVLVAGFLVVLVYSARLGHGTEAEIEPEVDAASDYRTTLEEELESLEEAAVFFSASIAPQELGRLLSARLESVLNGQEVDFYFPDKNEHSDDLLRYGSQLLRSANMRTGRSDLAYKSIASSRVTYSKDLQREGESFSEKTIAVPLFRGSEAFGAITFSSGSDSEADDVFTAEMIASRVAPLIAGSIAYQDSVDNALTDSLTKLPNERALFLVLENQVAESERFGTERPLAVLALDIESFDEINERFGHSVGDKVLAYSGQLVRDNLRKMDFLARTSDDEFFVVLPKAGVDSTAQVIARLNKAFTDNPFTAPDLDVIEIRPCFGTAVFGEDSETAAGLLRRASENKRIQKAPHGGSLLRFPLQ